MPSKSQRRAKSRGGSSSKSSSSRQSAPGDVRLFNMSVAGRAERVTDPQDLTHRPPDRTLRVTVPRNLLNQVVWLQCQTSTFFDLNNITVTPFSRTFSLSATPFAAEVQTLFDQYSIYAVKACYNLRSAASPGTTQIATVIDYDGQSFLTPPSTFPTLQQFGTCLTTMLNIENSHERFLKPCSATSVFNSTGSAFTAYATDRMWVDSGIATVPFYGLLGVADVFAGGNNQVQETYTYVVCCRNNN